VVGGSALFMNTDADYKSRTPLTSSTTDIKIDKIFNSDNRTTQFMMAMVDLINQQFMV